MAPYIGTSTSRVDGFEKVTGAAKYAAEFKGLRHFHSRDQQPAPTAIPAAAFVIHYVK
jgi:hypothetical protein